MIIKVGIDARILSNKLTGIGRYTLKICTELLKIKGVSLYLYSPAPLLEQYVCDLNGAIIQTGNIRSSILQQLWGETYLPLWADKDGVDIFWGPAHRLPRMLTKRIAKVVTIHDLVWKYSSASMRPLSYMSERLQMPFAIGSADCVAVVSESTSKAVNDEFCVDSERMVVIPPGVDLIEKVGSFSSLQEIGINSPYFLFVGTIEPRKNLVNLLSAYASIPTHIKKQSQLIIAGGNGWGRIDLKNEINHLNISEYVRLLGYVDELTLTTLYANAQFLAMPSLYEGFGIPLIEAMIHNVPVLTSTNSSMPEVAGDAGVLVDANSIESITKGLIKLITNVELRMILAENAKSNAMQFNWGRSTEQLMAVFKSVVKSKGNDSL